MGLLEKQLADLTRRHARKAKEVAAIPDPWAELADLERQLAEARAQQAACEAELAQLRIERDDLAPALALFDALTADQHAAVRYLDNLERLCIRGYVGYDEVASRARAMAMNAAAQHPDMRNKFNSIVARIAELEG